MALRRRTDRHPFASNRRLIDGDTELALSALRMAVARRQPPSGRVVHSDRGAQFAGAAYRAAFVKHGALASVSRQGNCYDNAYIESFWSSLKIGAIFDHIEGFYNPRWCHSALGYLSPTNSGSQLN